MTTNGYVRTTGLVYLLMILTSSIAYSIGQSLTKGDAAAIFDRIQKNQTLFATSIVIGAIGFIAWLVLGYLFYRLFEQYGRTAASLLLAFVGVGVPLSLAAVACQMNALSLIRGIEGLPALAGGPLQLEVMLALRGNDHLGLFVNVFSGLWLIPLGWLILRCGFLPKVLGVLLMLGSVGYLMVLPGTVMIPDYANSLAGRLIFIISGIPSLIGELGTCLWLLIRGMRKTESSHPI